MEIIPDSTAKPRAGQFLLSEPFLTDPWFGRKTVFLCDHDADGTVGLVLDNGTGRRLKEVLPESEAWGIDHEVSLGGPVHDDSLFFLHRLVYGFVSPLFLLFLLLLLLRCIVDAQR